jgi:magnesium transporter
MFYLSEVIGKQVVDRQGNPVARIRDIVVELASDTSPAQTAEAEDSSKILLNEEGEAVERDVPVVKGILARAGRKNEPFFIPGSQVIELGRNGARLASPKVDLTPYARREGEMLLARDLWDKQVIDLKTRKVVRVNDVVLTGAKPSTEDAPTARWWLRGVDVGFGGMLRRVHLNKVAQTITRKPVHPRIVPWQHLDVFGSNVPGGVPLLHKKLAQLHPVEIARITDAVSYHQGAEIIASLDDTLAADTLEEIVADRQTDIVEDIPEERAADIIEEMAPDEAVDLLSELPEDKAGALLKQMDEEEAQEVRQLMRYPEHSAGGIMTTDFVYVLPEMTVDQVIEANKPVFMSADLIYYMYVVESEDEKKLVGIITVRDLLIHERTTRVSDFMLTEFLSVRPGEKQQEVARKMAEYNLLALPVVDRNDRLLGVVTVDDALDALLPEGWQKRLPKIFS